MSDIMNNSEYRAWLTNVKSKFRNSQIKSDLYNREGKAITNFESTLPETYSDLSNEAIKDSYIFDFLNISKKYSENELETALIKNISKFLLEFGKGFAFIGNQYHLELSGKD